MPHAILRWLQDDVEVARLEGNFGLAMGSWMKVSKQIVKAPREEAKSVVLTNQTAEPELQEGTSLRLFFDNLCCEITFGSVSEAMEYKDVAMSCWQKKSAPAPVKVLEPGVPKPAPEPPRKRPRFDDDGFTTMSSMNQLKNHGETLSSKRAALDSRVETKTSADLPLARMSYAPAKRLPFTWQILVGLLLGMRGACGQGVEQYSAYACCPTDNAYNACSAYCFAPKLGDDRELFRVAWL
ncbi:UBP23 [Symbiodinium natans]|uniref:UBP23 protein n=1 Tax=Symbiodinium natans TaxID=878477 RepID=A0A812NNE3_9DINO|nr:UBP23 [Symbiodinium natans]